MRKRDGARKNSSQDNRDTARLQNLEKETTLQKEQICNKRRTNLQLYFYK
jgi:hypothetical protein